MAVAYSNLVSRLRTERRVLGMSYAVVARRSGVSEPTVKRIFGGKGASFENVVAVAEALGLPVLIGEGRRDALRLEQAELKAQRIARMVQATSALEAQAVDSATVQHLVERSVHELMAGSKRRLWG